MILFFVLFMVRCELIVMELIYEIKVNVVSFVWMQQIGMFNVSEVLGLICVGLQIIFC